MKKVGRFLARGLLRLLGSMPLKVHYFLSPALGWAASSLIRYRHDNILINLSRSFPSKTYSEIKDVRNGFYAHLADLIVETIWFGGCTSADRLKDSGLISVRNPEVLSDLYESSPSVVVMFSHCGNWELMGGVNHSTEDRLNFTADDTVAVYRKLSSPFWNEVMKDNRFAIVPKGERDRIDGYVESSELIRYCINHRQDRKVYYINTDQRPYFDSPGNMAVEFLHQQCMTMSGAASIARKFGYALVYQSMRRNGRGHYEIEYTPLCADAGSMTVEDIMKTYYSLLEKDIEEQPENYLWSHNRWYRKKR